MQWLQSFDEWTARELGIDEESVLRLLAAENNTTVQHLETLSHEELGRIRSIRVLAED